MPARAVAHRHAEHEEEEHRRPAERNADGQQHRVSRGRDHHECRGPPAVAAVVGIGSTAILTKRDAPVDAKAEQQSRRHHVAPSVDMPTFAPAQTPTSVPERTDVAAELAGDSTTTPAKSLNDLNMMMNLLEEAETRLATVASFCQDFAQRLVPPEVTEMRRDSSDAPPTADRLDASADEPAQAAIGEGTATVSAAAATSAAAVPVCDSVAAQECAVAELAHRGQTTAARPAAVATACEGASEYEDVARNLNDYFGSFPKCFVLLFYIVTGGEDWSQSYRALAEMNEYSWVYKWWLVAYLVIMVFGVLNVITAIFVECSLSKAQADRELSLATEDKKTKAVKDAKSLLALLDLDAGKSHEITRSQILTVCCDVIPRLGVTSRRYVCPLDSDNAGDWVEALAKQSLRVASISSSTQYRFAGDTIDFIQCVLPGRFPDLECPLESMQTLVVPHEFKLDDTSESWVCRSRESDAGDGPAEILRHRLLFAQVLAVVAVEMVLAHARGFRAGKCQLLIMWCLKPLLELLRASTRASGRGGQPVTYVDTGITRSTPFMTE